MASEKDYQAIRTAIEDNGFFTSFIPFYEGDEVDVWLVVHSKMTDGRPHGNSFQISTKSGNWYLVTWSPVIYKVPSETDLLRLCLDCLQASSRPLGELPPDMVDRYRLATVSAREAGYS